MSTTWGLWPASSSSSLGCIASEIGAIGYADAGASLGLAPCGLTSRLGLVPAVCRIPERPCCRLIYRPRPTDRSAFAHDNQAEVILQV